MGLFGKNKKEKKIETYVLCPYCENHVKKPISTKVFDNDGDYVYCLVCEHCKKILNLTQEL